MQAMQAPFQAGDNAPILDRLLILCTAKLTADRTAALHCTRVAVSRADVTADGAERILDDLVSYNGTDTVSILWRQVS